MPLPMVHLAVAVQLAEKSNQHPSPAFLLGSIAPDAIHMRPGIDRDHKEITHLNSPTDTDDHQQVRDMVVKWTSNPSPSKEFAAGYAAHILVDRLWIKTIVRPFQASVPAEMDENQIKHLYYQETDQIDCDLYKYMPWREAVWANLSAAAAPDFQPWLTAAEIAGWQTRTLKWFAEPANEPCITPQYLTNDKVAAFISAAAHHLQTQFSAWDLDGVV